VYLLQPQLEQWNFGDLPVALRPVLFSPMNFGAGI